MFLKHVKTVKHVKTYIGNVGFIYITCLGLAIDAEWSAGLFFAWFPGGRVFYERAVSFS